MNIINSNHTVKGCSFNEALIYYILHHLYRKVTFQKFDILWRSILKTTRI